MLGLRVLSPPSGRSSSRISIGAGGQLAGLAVDQLQLPLDAEARALGGLEGDPHLGESRFDHCRPPQDARAITRPTEPGRGRPQPDRNRDGAGPQPRRRGLGASSGNSPARNPGDTGHVPLPRGRRAAVFAVLTSVFAAGLIAAAGPASAIPFEGDPGPDQCVRVVPIPGFVRSPDVFSLGLMQVLVLALGLLNSG